MPQRIYVSVLGFTDAERHALNTVFRLSEERSLSYAAWSGDAPEAAQLTLADGQSAAAQDWLSRVPEGHTGALFWVGSIAPAHAVRVFERPLHWPDVLQAMDALFAPGPALDLDFDLDAPEPAAPAPAAPPRRALVLDADREARLYLRAKLATVGIYLMDEALHGVQALGMLRSQPYDLAVLDLAQPAEDGDVWKLVAQVKAIVPPIPLVLLTTPRRSAWLRLRGWLAGVQGVLPKPPHPAKLQKLLQKI